MKKRLSEFKKKGLEDITDPNTRAFYGYRGAMVSIIVNIFLFFIKIVLGLFINSVALIADGVHSLSDIVSSVIVLIGFYFYKKPADPHHPLGHGRAEYVSTLILSVILIIAGLVIARESIEKFFRFEPLLNEPFLPFIAGVVLITALIKELIARYCEGLSKKIQSNALKADAWHHRTDAISSIGVAVGIIGAYFGFYSLDAVFGIMISLIILYVGVDLIKKSANELIGVKPDESVLSTLHDIARECTGLENIHDISIHDYGTMKIVTLHATFDKDLSLEKAHYIADCFERDVKEKLDLSAVVHLEPEDKRRDDLVSKEHEVVSCINKFKDDVIGFHKMQLIVIDDTLNVKIHIIVKPSMTVEDSHYLYEKIKQCIHKKIGKCEIDIHFDPYVNDIKGKK